MDLQDSDWSNCGWRISHHALAGLVFRWSWTVNWRAGVGAGTWDALAWGLGRCHRFDTVMENPVSKRRLTSARVCSYMLTQDGQVEAAITVHGPRRRRRCSERTRSAMPSMATVKTGRGNLAPLDERLSTAAHREKKRRSMHSDGSATSTGCWRTSSGGAAAMMTNW